MTETIETPPDPFRMIEGLRDTGYQFNTAVADVVDNSIAADATYVEIDLNLDLRGKITLAIYDDGIGMDRAGLINAMKYGSKPRPSAASLGKFGLGLKTASTAFCRKLVVLSKDSAEAPLLSATWDLAHIKDTNKWELIINKPTTKQEEAFKRVIGAGRGTMVLWEDVDRLLKNFANPTGAPAQNALRKIRDELRIHLSMVYQRFLDAADARVRNLTIRLNEQDVLPWNPFCPEESEVVSEEVPQVELPDGTIASFSLKAFILPRPEEFSSAEAAANARIRTDNQGIYIYREHRLIHGPDWLKIASKEPHSNLLRVEFSFDHKLDEAFQIDIKKSQIILNETIHESVTDFLTPPRRAAQEKYRKGTQAKTSAATKSAHDGSNRNISSMESEVSKPEIKSIDADKNEADILNKQGLVRLKLTISTAAKPLEVHVQPVPSIDDGLLWEPCLIDGHCGVRVNTSHPYYHKVYLPNITEGVTIQGMDALLWGLSVAELNCVSDSTKAIFGELRYEVTRNLRKLVENMPEPAIRE